MKKFFKFFLICSMAFCLNLWWIGCSQANCGVCDLPQGEDIPLEPQETPPSSSTPPQSSESSESAPAAEPSSPASPSDEPSSSDPSAPEVYQKMKTWTDALPELPGYGQTSEDSPYGPPAGGGQSPAPAPQKPMVNKGLMDKIRSTPRTPVDEKPTATFPSTCDECFLVVVNFLTPNVSLSESLKKELEEKALNDALKKASNLCKETFEKDTCSWGYVCPSPNKEIVSEQIEDGVKTTAKIYLKCHEEPLFIQPAPKPSAGEMVTVTFFDKPKPGEEGQSSSGRPGVIITEEEEIDFDGTVPPEPPDGPQPPKPPQPPGSSTVPEDKKEAEEEKKPSDPVILGEEKSKTIEYDVDGSIISEKPSGCGECFKVSLEMPWSSDPFGNFESQWQEAAFNQAKGICQQTCADKGCTFSIPCGERPVEQEEIYPENLMFDPQTGQTSGMKVRIGVYYKCIPPIGEQTTSQVTVPPPKEAVTIPPEETFIMIKPKETPITITYIDHPKDTSVTDIPKEIVTPPKETVIIPPEETVTVPKETVTIPKETVIPPKEEDVDIPKEKVIIPKETVTPPPKEVAVDVPKEIVTIPKEDVLKVPKEEVVKPPKEEDVYIPKEKVTKTKDKDKVTVPPKDIDKPPKEVDYPPPKEEEECDCKYLDQEWVIWQTIEGKYVYIPDPKINYKIPIEGYKRRVELKAAGADEDILILRAEKTKDGERVCVRSKNVFSPDLIEYKWQIMEGPGNFKNGGRADEGEAVIYIPPKDLPFGEHVVVIETTIDDVPGKAPDQENKGKIRMLIKHREEEPDFYFIDFGVTPFNDPGGFMPPELPCACEISTEWEEEVPLSHNIVFPGEGAMYCPECTDIWVGNGSDVDRLKVKCADPECGEDIRKFPIVDVWIHNWAAHFGSYLDGNAGRKVLYKAPEEVPPVPIPNEGVILNTRDSGRQFVDREPEPDKKKITIVDVDLVIHKPAVIDPAESEIPEEDEFTKGSQTFVNLDNDDLDARFDTGTTDISVAGEDEMVKLTLRLKPNSLDQGTVSLEALTGSQFIKVWRQVDKTTEYVLGMPLAVPTDFTVHGEWLETNLYVEGIQPHTDQRQTRLQMIYDLVPDCADEVALTVISIDKIEWIGKNNSRNDDNALDADPNFPAGLGVNSLRVFPDARMAGGAVEGNFRDKVDVKVTLTVKPIEPVNLYFDSFDVDDPTSNQAPVDNEAVNQDNRGEVPDRTGHFEGEAAWIKEQNFDEKEETLLFQVTRQPGDNFRVVGNGDPDFLNNLDNRDAALGPNNADQLRIVNKHVTGTPVDREVREPAHYASEILTVWRFLHIEIDSMGVVTGNDVQGEVVDMTPRDAATAIRLDVSNNLDDGSLNLSGAPPRNGRFENGQITFTGNPAVSAVQANGNDFVRNAAGFNIVPLPFSAEDNDWWSNSTFSGTLTSITHKEGNWVLQLNITAQSDPAIDWPDFVGGEVSVSGGTGMPIAVVIPALSRVEVSALNLPYTMTDDDVLAGDVPDPDTSGMAATYGPAFIVPLFDTGKNTPAAPFILNSPVANMPNHINASKGTPLSVDHFWVATVLGAYQTNAKLHPKWHGDNDPDSERTTRAVSFRDVHSALFGNESIRDWIATPLPLGGNGVDPAGAGRQTRHQEILNHEIGHLFGLEHNPDGDVTAQDPQGGVMLPSCCPPDNPALNNTRGASTFTQRSLSIIRSRNHPGF